MRQAGVGCLITMIIVFVGFLGGCDKHSLGEPSTDTRFLLDTICTVTVYSNADKKAATEALDLCAADELLFSRTAENSDIWRVNHGDGEPIEVNPSTAELIRLGLAYGAFSAGKFDITIGRLSSLWDFGNSEAIPPGPELAAALETVDYQAVQVRGNTVHMENADAWLDLGGIAKGYVADRMAALLKERGVQRAIIDLGGNIVTVGTKPQGEPWSIGVREPFSGRNGLVGIVKVGEAAIVTSGIYERYFLEEGVFYHHILDPEQGWPAESDLASATIIADTSAAGDALSTLFLMAGSAKGEELLEKCPEVLGVVLVLKSGEVQYYGDIDFTPAEQEG